MRKGMSSCRYFGGNMTTDTFILFTSVHFFLLLFAFMNPYLSKVRLYIKYSAIFLNLPLNSTPFCLILTDETHFSIRPPGY